MKRALFLAPLLFALMGNWLFFPQILAVELADQSITTEQVVVATAR